MGPNRTKCMLFTLQMKKNVYMMIYLCNLTHYLFLFFFAQSGSCWVKLNVFNLEESLRALARKFGNISSNRDHINTFIQILREMRYHIGHAVLVSSANYIKKVLSPSTSGGPDVKYKFIKMLSIVSI